MGSDMLLGYGYDYGALGLIQKRLAAKSLYRSIFLDDDILHCLP
jgi:hypothetical protein